LSKEQQYQGLLKQAAALFEGENNTIANMSNLCALLHHSFGFWWTGFYLVENNELVLGPFQGPVACTRIGFGKGVCGTAWKENKPLVVPNVHEFEGHITCSADSNSEIVLPVYNQNQCIGVFDVDSRDFDTFDNTDVVYLQKLLSLITK
jgi:L-methionine (R)-S-oxide reductase